MQNLPIKKTRLLVIGSPRSGMGWLERNIDRHPLLCTEATLSDDVKQLVCHVDPNLAIAPSEDIAVLRYHLAKAKIVYILRNPAERSLSYLRQSLDGKALDDISESRMIESLLREPATHSFYTNNIIRWQRVWGDDLKVLFYDDLIANPRKFFKGIEKLLNIKDTDFRATRMAQRSSNDMDLPEAVTRYTKRLYRQELAELQHTVDSAYLETWTGNVK